MAVFEDGAHRTLTEVFSTFTSRGVEYADSWHTDYQPGGFVDSMRSVVGEDRSREANRLIRIAGLVDTKISRIVAGGEFKRDSYVDLIAYLALMCDLHQQYAESHKAASLAFPLGTDVAITVIDGVKHAGNTNGATRCVA